MNAWKVILATLVIFVAGVVTGGLLVSYSDNVLRHPHKTAGPEAPKHNAQTTAASRDARPLLAPIFLIRKEFLERLDRELKLTPEQRGRIEKIISEGQDRIKGVCQKVDPEAREEIAKTREKIRAELTNDQIPLFAELLKRRPNPARGTNAPAAVASTNSPRSSPPN